MIDAGIVMILSGLIPALITAGFLAWTRTLPADCRRYGYAVAGMTGVLSVMYLIMGTVTLTTGDEPVMVRFIAYTPMWVLIAFVVCAIAGVGRRLSLILLVLVVARVWGTPIGWYVDGLLGTLVSIGTFGAVFVGIAFLFGPFMRVASQWSEERTLLYVKLKHLVAISWIALAVTGLISQDSLGLTDPFVGQVIAVYVELIFLGGLGAVVLRSSDALEDVAASEERGSSLEFDSDESATHA